jgi:phosphoribosylformimino-5-aminoimidazole carboxamide ribotide isomerase
MRIVPVLDLKAGQAVRAVAGDRAHYPPLRSLLHEGTDPIGLARVLRQRFGFQELYLADLDAICGSPPALGVYRELALLGLDLWVDAGLRDVRLAETLSASGVSTLVAGLETLEGPDVLGALVRQLGPGRIVFSLDLRGGRPLLNSNAASWRVDNTLELAQMAFDQGIRRLLLLDLARVGTGTGTGTIELVRALRHRAPLDTELAVGGGVSGAADLPALRNSGASVVLVGSALHQGTIVPADLDR